MYKQPLVREFTIPNGQTSTGKIHVGDYVITGVITPATLTGTAFTFKAGLKKDDTFMDVYDSDGVQVSAAAAASRAIGLSGLEADALAPFPWIEIVSNAAEAADRTIGLALK